MKFLNTIRCLQIEIKKNLLNFSSKYVVVGYVFTPQLYMQN